MQIKQTFIQLGKRFEPQSYQSVKIINSMKIPHFIHQFVW